MGIVGVIDGEPIESDDIIRHLRIAGQMPALIAEVAMTAAVAREAIAAGVLVSDEGLQAGADDFRRAAGLLTAEDTENFLGARGWSVPEFEAHIERSLTRAGVRARVATKEKVEARFRERGADYRLFAVSQISVETAEKAQEILSQVRDGEIRFDDAARKYSLERLTAPGGGYMGYLRLSQFPTHVRGALHGVKPGDILGPFEIPGGVTALRIEEIREPELTGGLGEEIAEAIFAEWLDEKVNALNAGVVAGDGRPAAQGA